MATVPYRIPFRSSEGLLLLPLHTEEKRRTFIFLLFALFVKGLLFHQNQAAQGIPSVSQVCFRSRVPPILLPDNTRFDYGLEGRQAQIQRLNLAMVILWVDLVKVLIISKVSDASRRSRTLSGSVAS
jgi:hypothetical protein